MSVNSPERAPATIRLRDLPLWLRVGLFIAGGGPVLALAAFAFVFRDSRLSQDPATWGQFGDYVGGTLGWLLSLLALVAVYATYSKQHQAELAQRAHDDESMRLLREQSAHTAQQIETLKHEAFYSQLRGLASNLIESILACRRDHRSFGFVAGHSYFSEFSDQLWSRYVEAQNRNDSEPWRQARNGLFASDEGNWHSVRGQITSLVIFIVASMAIREEDRRVAMMVVTSQLSPGVSLLLAVDSFLGNGERIADAAVKYGLYRAIAPHVREALMRDGICSASAFDSAGS